MVLVSSPDPCSLVCSSVSLYGPLSFFALINLIQDLLSPLLVFWILSFFLSLVWVHLVIILIYNFLNIGFFFMVCMMSKTGITCMLQENFSGFLIAGVQFNEGIKDLDQIYLRALKSIQRVKRTPLMFKG